MKPELGGGRVAWGGGGKVSVGNRNGILENHCPDNAYKKDLDCELLSDQLEEFVYFGRTRNVSPPVR